MNKKNQLNFTKLKEKIINFEKLLKQSFHFSKFLEKSFIEVDEKNRQKYENAEKSC